jgi:predicted transcriptional regulator
MVRTQLYINEDLHQRLKTLARKQGRTVSDLVREAVARVYAPVGVDERLETLRAVEGIWRDHEEVGEAHEYVRRMRADTRRMKPRR